MRGILGLCAEFHRCLPATWLSLSGHSDSIFGTSTGAQGTSQWKGWDDQAWATAMNDYGVKPVSGNGAVWGGGSSAANFRQNPY